MKIFHVSDRVERALQFLAERQHGSPEQALTRAVLTFELHARSADRNTLRCDNLHIKRK